MKNADEKVDVSMEIVEVQELATLEVDRGFYGNYPNSQSSPGGYLQMLQRRGSDKMINSSRNADEHQGLMGPESVSVPSRLNNEAIDLQQDPTKLASPRSDAFQTRGGPSPMKPSNAVTKLHQ